MILKKVTYHYYDKEGRKVYSTEVLKYDPEWGVLEETEAEESNLLITIDKVEDYKMDVGDCTESDIY
jgi:hypothetical protein